MISQCTLFYGRKKNNVDKDDLIGPDNRFQNWIWKKTNEVEDDDNDTIAILTEHQGLRTRLKNNKTFGKS